MPRVPRRQAWKKSGGLCLDDKRQGAGHSSSSDVCPQCKLCRVVLLILLFVTIPEFCVIFKGCCHAVEGERGSVVPACTKSDLSMYSGKCCLRLIAVGLALADF